MMLSFFRLSTRTLLLDAQRCTASYEIVQSRTASYEITLVCLSVCLSVRLSVCVCLSIRLSVCLSIRLSLNFLKTGSLAFSDIVHDDRLPYLVTNKARFLKKNSDPKLSPTGLNQTQNAVFLPFS